MQVTSNEQWVIYVSKAWTAMHQQEGYSAQGHEVQREPRWRNSRDGSMIALMQDKLASTSRITNKVAEYAAKKLKPWPGNMQQAIESLEYPTMMA
jgi:hypothetical protein